MAKPLKPEFTLTPREFKAVALLALDGAQGKDIGKALGVVPNTIKTMLWRARQKTGQETRVALALWFNRTYPSGEARKQGYANACIRVAEANVEAGKRQNHHG